MKIFWSVLLERTVADVAVNGLLDVATTTALHAATIASQRISVPYGRVDVARNAIVDAFLRMSTRVDDVLVMLDNDQVHPHDVIVRLAETMGPRREVVGAAYRRRNDPFDWLAFRREEPRVVPGQAPGPIGNLVALRDEEMTGGLVAVEMIATGAIAIRRSVFEKLQGDVPRPWFRYAYRDESWDMPSEDVYFSGVCEWMGIGMWCHTGIVSKHLTTTEV